MALFDCPALQGRICTKKATLTVDYNLQVVKYCWEARNFFFFSGYLLDLTVEIMTVIPNMAWQY